MPLLRRPAGGEWFGMTYDRYFFHEPLWIVSHNILHAPLILAALFAVGHAARSCFLSTGRSGSRHP